MQRLSSEDLEKVKRLLPFSNDYVDKYTPESLKDLPLECVFHIRPLTVSERKKWVAAAKEIADVERMNRLAISKAIEDGKTTIPKASAETAEQEMYSLLASCVQKVFYWVINEEGAEPFSGGVRDLPEWLVADLSKRLTEISSLTREDGLGFGF